MKRYRIEASSSGRAILDDGGSQVVALPVYAAAAEERLVTQANLAVDFYEAVAAWCTWMDHEPFDGFTANVETIDDLLHEAYHKAQELEQ